VEWSENRTERASKQSVHYVSFVAYLKEALGPISRTAGNVKCWPVRDKP